jgi:geranylgeranyl reductase family protein
VHVDVAVVGAGPAGSVAALLAARGGARVALIDKAAFPRDKACGDLVGPRGVRLLEELGVTVPGVGRAGEMLVVGPTGRQVRLPAPPGPAYADHAWIAPRRSFDDQLRAAALDADVIPVHARCTGLTGSSGDRPVRVRWQQSVRAEPIDADFVVGADGATSTIARSGGLVDDRASLWAFALRGYLPGYLPEPVIALRDEEPWHAFPGYGWAFPGPDGALNVGVGVGLGADRRAAGLAGKRLGVVVEQLHRAGFLDRPDRLSQRAGGWLRVGGVGVAAAKGRVLLVGDAAALVNPLQGEGIAPAMHSAQLAVQAVLDHPAWAADTYRAALRESYRRYFAAAVTLHTAMLRRPVLTAALGRVMTIPGLRRAIAATWSLSWNDLVDGAAPSVPATNARLLRSTIACIGANHYRNVATGPNQPERSSSITKGE